MEEAWKSKLTSDVKKKILQLSIGELRFSFPLIQSKIEYENQNLESARNELSVEFLC